MIQTVERSTTTTGIERTGPPASAPAIAPPSGLQKSELRGPLAPGDQRRGLPSFDPGRQSPVSLGEQLIEAIRPKRRVKTSFRPVRVRLSLLRLADAIEDLEITADDPLLKTAHRLLAEEQLMVEMVRHRLQMVLEG